MGAKEYAMTLNFFLGAVGWANKLAAIENGRINPILL